MNGAIFFSGKYGSTAQYASWIGEAIGMPVTLISSMRHVALGGRQKPEELSRWDWLILIIGAWKNKDPEAKREELEGFDFVDKSSIKPILEWANSELSN